METPITEKEKSIDSEWYNAFRKLQSQALEYEQALLEISTLDYTKAATNGSAFQACRLAVDTLTKYEDSPVGNYEKK